MHTSASSKVSLCKDCDSLRILVFWKILKTNNIFLIDSNYFDGKSYTNKHQEEILDTWFNIYDEFFKLRNSGSSRSILQEKTRQVLFKRKLDLIIATNKHLNVLIESKNDLSSYTFNKMLDNLYNCYKKIDSKIKVSPKKSIDENIKIINSVYNGLNNTYNFSVKKSEKKVDVEIKNIHSVVVQVEQILNRSLQDIETMSVSRWIALEDMANKIVKERKNSKQHGRRK